MLGSHVDATKFPGCKELGPGARDEDAMRLALRTSGMCLQAAPRVKAEEANHPRSYSPKPLASRTEPIRVGRFGSTVSRLHSSCARNSGKGSVKSSKAVGFEQPECVYVCVRASVFVAESLCFEECMF